MNKSVTTAIAVLVTISGMAHAKEDNRALVEMPTMMQQHMLGNMRDHVEALHEILTAISEDNLDVAASIAETRLGMSSLDDHGASHMAPFMPQQMGAIGTSMHKAASRFSRTAEEGDRLAAYDHLNQITAACVACHAGYKIH